ncbi:MAG: DUF115 domain-containing protein [Lachnospiraceae bacterium]|nr:DUF115 domain-containing protein [Lachnospiraceae bacterium]
MYYFFGAGNNCHSAIEFFGIENIYAIVDNDKTKVGSKLRKISIISFDEFLEKYNNEKVIITTNTGALSVSRQLEKVGIKNYYVCPYMQSGFYNAKEIVERWNLIHYENITFYSRTPISEKIISEINKKCGIHYFDKDNINLENQNKEVLVITEVDDSEKLSHIEYDFFKVLDLNKDIERWHAEEFQYLKEYYNKHNGDVCFLVGNGPSLTDKDLECIHNHNIYSFGCNGIYKIFSKTNWRPDFYMLGDNIFFEKEQENLPNECNYFIRKIVNQDKMKNKKVHFYCGKFENYFPGYPSFSTELEKGVYGGRTIMYDMLQFAVYMGFKKIYLIGVDFSWGKDGNNTHFCESYSDGIREKFAVSYKEEIKNAYYSARQYADSHGVKIYNATRGGKLEVFERKNLDEVFAEIENEKM